LYRDLGCVLAEFNLLLFLDAPAVFRCPPTEQGASFWHLQRGPLQPLENHQYAFSRNAKVEIVAWVLEGDPGKF
jgi:hypothetical protein